jgi:hypothetical protein
LTPSDSVPAVTYREEEVASMGAERAVPALAVGALAVVLGVLPAIAALGLFPAGAQWAVAGLGGLAAVWGGAKLAVAVCGLMSARAGSVSRPELMAEVD